MIFIYIQTIKGTKNIEIPYRITVSSPDWEEKLFFNIRPQISISKRIYQLYKLNRIEIISAPPFCELAEELIELFLDKQLVFTEVNQFRILKSQFKIIGYNFNIKPKFVFNAGKEGNKDLIQFVNQNSSNASEYSSEFAISLIDFMKEFIKEKTIINSSPPLIGDEYLRKSISNFKTVPGVYFFLNDLDEVLYVGKAKNIKKRLQSHFSNQYRQNNIDYSKVKHINVEYTGNDIIAQLVESNNIKDLQPLYNTQQIVDPAPYIINKGKTAKGVFNLKITRKEFKDNLPEKFFNRASVQQSLENFCMEHQLCRKHCGLERIKGPCSNFISNGNKCVCTGEESIDSYNKRFEIALQQYLEKKSRKIYKLKGRTRNEDAFIYMVNGIYEGYGFIDKEETITNQNDILGHLTLQNNNYDTSRIVSGLNKKVLPHNILSLSD